MSCRHFLHTEWEQGNMSGSAYSSRQVYLHLFHILTNVIPAGADLGIFKRRAHHSKIFGSGSVTKNCTIKKL